MTALWSDALRRLSNKIAPQNYEMWLRPIEFRGLDGTTLRLRAPNQYVRLWFESNYLDVVLDELRADRSAEGVQYVVEFDPDGAPDVADTSGDAVNTQSHSGSPSGSSGSRDTESGVPISAASAAAADAAERDTPDGDFVHTYADSAGQPVPAHAAPLGQAPATAPRATGSGTQQTAQGVPTGVQPSVHASVHTSGAAAPTHLPPPLLNPKYTFDTFVSGPSNQLAFAASQAAASSYPPKYNPIFICGGVGLGKTHLLHSIGHVFLTSRPGSRILYISGERFMNEYIHAIRTNRMPDFRDRYRKNCDVLLVDDVQFLAGKDGTQDEFFHTFNALHDAHRQIVLTADRKPYEISDIADRLRTRFAWGLLADIEPPELEVRVAILRKKAAAESIYLPDDVALYIAGAVKSNVRELEGALIRLAAYASLSNKDITLDFAHETLDGSIARPREHLTVESIIKAVANYYGLKVSDIKSSRRHKSIAGPRAVAMFLARTHTKDSYPDLGRAFGGKHHTTVISAVEKISKKQKTEPGLRGELHAIESILLR